RQNISTLSNLLSQQIGYWGTTDRTYDIIGHSLGGVVATNWAATETDQAKLAAVHSIITLDSPVGGLIDPKYYSTYFISSGGSAGKDLQTSSLINTMATAPNTVDIFTFGNTYDVVIPVDEAILSGACPSLVTPCLFTITGSLTGMHSLILGAGEL